MEATTRVCEHTPCSAEFETTRTDKRFCSKRCKERAREVRKFRRYTECKTCHAAPVGNRSTGQCSDCERVRWLRKDASNQHYAPPLVNGAPLTGPQYRAFFDRAGNVCENPNCDNPATCLDHDHETGEVRGVLCHGCNTAEGMIHGSILRLYGLIAYLSA